MARAGLFTWYSTERAFPVPVYPEASMKTSILLSGLVLAGCASYSGYGLHPGSSSENDVRQTMGRPAVELAEPGGGKELFYPRGPLGTQTFAVHVDSGGTLKNIDQVLDDDHFAAIHEGQTRDEVLRRIGPPGDTMGFRNGNYAWIYRFKDTWGYLSDFNVTFNRENIVVAKIAIRVERNDGKDR
jgi:outer membrane protein assembly factor BamE (lipoprotein component of BamABCDE complex)